MDLYDTYEMGVVLNSPNYESEQGNCRVLQLTVFSYIRMDTE